LLPSVAHPPLPLQEFLPLHPLSPVLQPPLPLQEFFPLQEFLSGAGELAGASSIWWMAVPELPVAAACTRADVPVKRPAIAAPTIIAFDDIFMMFCLSVGAAG
jgi:hypothetical protein